MALSNEEKIRILIDKAGGIDAVTEVLAQAGFAEKQADEQGVAFKHAKEVNAEPEPESGEDDLSPNEILEYLRENPAKAKQVMAGLGTTKKEGEADAEPEVEAEPTSDDVDVPVTALTVKELASVVYDVFTEAQQEVVSEKEAGITATLKEYQDKQDIKFKELGKKVDGLTSLIAELVGYQPRATTKGYRASEANETVLSDGNAYKQAPANYTPGNFLDELLNNK